MVLTQMKNGRQTEGENFLGKVSHVLAHPQRSFMGTHKVYRKQWVYKVQIIFLIPWRFEIWRFYFSSKVITKADITPFLSSLIYAHP